MKPLKTYTLDEMLDLHIGEKGTQKREHFEYELQMDIIAHKIKEERLRQHLSQSQLGEMIGVKKSQISKLEKGLIDTRIGTLIKVFNALNTKLKIIFEIDNNKVVLS